VVLDIFSHKTVRWEVHATETSDLAKEFIENAIKANGGARPDYIHADNGTSMTSKTVSQLLSDLNITRSHSRPHVSNDNPYSEAAFKTLKYCPVSPGGFAALDEARAFCGTEQSVTMAWLHFCRVRLPLTGHRSAECPYI
jgi:putative transposase